MPPLFVGLDLGGSGTRAALVNASGELLAAGRGPTGLHGAAAAGRRHLRRALDMALAPITARVGTTACNVFAGTRGLSIPGRRDSILLELHTRFANARVEVANDALIGLWGGLAGRPGVAVLAGSGSIALARTAEGREERVGGWGHLLGDEGSGYWLGREALQAYLRVLEHRASPGVLTSLVAEVIAAPSVPEAIAWLYRREDQVVRLAALAPLVTRAASAHDPLACALLSRAGEALAELAAAAARGAWPDGVPSGVSVACCGGVWAAGAALEAPFSAALEHLLPSAQASPALLPPVGGAVLLAMSADGTRPPADLDALGNLG